MERFDLLELDTHSLRQRFRSFCLLVTLMPLAWGLLPIPIGAGESAMEIPVPAGIEIGLDDAGIKIETKRNWLDDSTVWIVGGIIAAGLIVAYAIRRKRI